LKTLTEVGLREKVVVDLLHRCYRRRVAWFESFDSQKIQDIEMRRLNKDIFYRAAIDIFHLRLNGR